MPNPVINFAESGAERVDSRLADLPDRVVEGDPQHSNQQHFESTDGALIAGTWTSTPGRWHAFTDRDEFCVILAGHCRLIADDGTAKTFMAGDAFMIPNGFRGYWDVIETTTKHYVIRSYTPTED
ncbi:cupin domain-containing protein [Denitromonas halophila]|uniref:Cupin domain-containing protein n=1 Tax=Denitromonas halophila TaxID=1629404 RepID=A0A557QW11_9RHOO|nr:cupin domain-containing protein [Denitromonas halophila]TVO57098.1 cupin domain-containing protein [Denitromonas halophila]